jgi:SH3 domain protein
MRVQGLSAIFLFVVAVPALGQRLYTSDELIVLLRTGPSIQNAIIRNMRPGTELEVLERDAGNDYSRVRLAGTDVEGYVLSQYLTPERAARDQLVDAQRELASARARISELEAQVTQLQGNLDKTRVDLQTEQQSNTQISSELEDVRDASANAIALRDQNETLRQRVSQLTAQTDLLTMENTQLASRTRQNWFVVGAAVLFGGIVLGLVAPSLRRKKRSSW